MLFKSLLGIPLLACTLLGATDVTRGLFESSPGYRVICGVASIVTGIASIFIPVSNEILSEMYGGIGFLSMLLGVIMLGHLTPDGQEANAGDTPELAE